MADVYSIFPILRRDETHLKYQKAIQFLSKHPRLKHLFDLIGPLKYEIPIWLAIEDAVLYAVIGQMLSVQAAGTIIKRLLNDFGTSAEVISWASFNADFIGPMQGVSQRKRKALREWNIFWKIQGKKSKMWQSAPISEYRKQITSVWGLGRWSADMIAIFHLGRLDVWPETDGGINKVSKLVFGNCNYSHFKKFVEGFESVVAVYFWEMLNRKLIPVFSKTGHG